MYRILPAALLAVIIAFAGCNSDKTTNPTQPGGNNNTTTYSGFFAGGTESGSITINVPNAAVDLAQAIPGDTVTVTGTIKISGGATIALTGRFVRSTGAFLIMGGGYEFMGALANGAIAGEYYGPNGSGSFTVTISSSGEATRVFLGSYQANAPSTDHGTFSMIIKGSVVTVMAVDSAGGGTNYLGGTLSGNTITIVDPAHQNAPAATGTISGNNVSGTYTNSENGGTWSGTLSQ